MWVWVAVGKALLVGRRLVVPLVLVISLVERSIALQAVPGRWPTPAAPVRGSRRAVEGRAWGLVPGGARRPVPG